MGGAWVTGRSSRAGRWAARGSLPGELFPQAVQAALEEADVELEAPAGLFQAGQGPLVLGDGLAEVIQLEGLGPGLGALNPTEAGLDLGGEEGGGGLVVLNAASRCGELVAAVWHESDT